MSESVAEDAQSHRGRFRATMAQLETAQKKRGRGAPAYSIYVNRPLGRRVAAAAFLLGLAPNTVSLISAFFTFSAIILLAVLPPTVWLGALVTALLVIGYAFDSADGQVARLRGGGSPAGEWLDHVLDCIKCSTLHLSVLLSAFLHFNLSPQGWLLVPLGFSMVSAVSFFASILNDQLKARHPGPENLTEPQASTPLRSLVGLPTDYGVLCLIFLLLGWPQYFFVIYTLIFAANLGYLILALPKWFADMKALA